MKIGYMLAAVAALSLAGLGVADAAGKKKRRAPPPSPLAYVPPPASAYPAHTNGPPWAQPWECYTDEGYGRYLPCSMGKSD